jgi:hypothetical protein
MTSTMESTSCTTKNSTTVGLVLQYENRSYILSEFSARTWSFIRYGKHFKKVPCILFGPAKPLIGYLVFCTAEKRGFMCLSKIL